MKTRSMSWAEIAREEGQSRQHIANIGKTALRKVYRKIRLTTPDASPFDTLVMMQIGFDLDDNDTDMLFHLMPKEIQKEISKDAKKRFPRKVK